MCDQLSVESDGDLGTPKHSLASKHGATSYERVPHIVGEGGRPIYQDYEGQYLLYDRESSAWFTSSSSKWRARQRGMHVRTRIGCSSRVVACCMRTTCCCMAILSSTPRRMEPAVHRGGELTAPTPVTKLRTQRRGPERRNGILIESGCDFGIMFEPRLSERIN